MKGQNLLDVIEEVARAQDRISGLVIETNLQHSSHLSARSGGEVYLKLENLQHTGSFKVRGAFNKLLALSEERRKEGVVVASSGNHGAAVAFAANQLDAKCEVFVPEGASEAKVAAIREHGGTVHFFGNDASVAEVHARRHAVSNDQAYISPYNDAAVIGGQGTIAAEISRIIGPPDAIFVPVGGGGLISGIAGHLKGLPEPRTQVIGCQPLNSAVMARSVEAGRILEMESDPTLSDGTAGGLEAGAMTFDLCRRYVDEWSLVTEEEIADAMKSAMRNDHLLVEGAAGVSLAAFEKTKERFRGQRVVIVICGANIDLSTLKLIL